jgi:hypothetical protein
MHTPADKIVKRIGDLRMSRQRLMDIAVDNLRQFQAGNTINAVNM